MSGIYFHIPFCKQLCHYCDFHKSLSLRVAPEMLNCLQREIQIRKDYLNENRIESIYFGGGTPSIYRPEEIQILIEECFKHFDFAPNAEISLEANPDDLNTSYLSELAQTAVNRLSIGVQSFHDDDLALMNRRHTGKEAIESIQRSIDFGFQNLSIDLMYGIPGLNLNKWEENLETTYRLDVQHISSYHLMYEPNTIFSKKLKKDLLSELSEKESIQQFRLLIQTAKNQGFKQYEISNFCKEGYHSKHNLAYWKQKQYLGIGPSAHSYNFTEREWNVAHNRKYMDAVKQGRILSEKEKLSDADRCNDLILTSLRTCWGLNLETLKQQFGETVHDICVEKSEKFIQSKHLRKERNSLILTDRGIFISDHIIADFFV